MKNAVNYTEMSVVELEALKLTLTKDLFMLRNELSSSKKLEKPHLVREKKKQRARVLTALSAK